jgi:hypothetical protein
LAGIFGVLLVIITTFALAGRIPPAGTGSIIPPAVIAVFADAMKAAFVQLKFVNALAGHVTDAEFKFNGALPI